MSANSLQAIRNDIVASLHENGCLRDSYHHWNCSCREEAKALVRNFSTAVRKDERQRIAREQGGVALLKRAGR